MAIPLLLVYGIVGFIGSMYLGYIDIQNKLDENTWTD